MKKRFLLIALLAVLALCLTLACACNDDDNSVKATGIAISGTGVNNGKLTVMTGNRDLTLVATVRPSDATDKTVTWSSSNTSVATVSEQGVVSFLASGTATITAKCGDVSDSVEVTVNSRVPVEAISFKQTSYEASVLSGSGGMLDLSSEIVVEPSNATTRSVIWTIAPADEFVAISAQGLVVINEFVDQNAEYTITATSSSDPLIKGTVKMTIAQPKAEDIVVRLASNGASKKDGYVYNFYLDDKQFDSLWFVAEPRPVGTSGKCAFSSSNPEICDIEAYDDNNARLKIKAEGDVVITVKCHDVEKKINVKINPSAGYIIDGLNVLESELQTSVDTVNYWNFNDNPQVKPGSAFYSKQEYDSISGIGLFGSGVDGTNWNCKQNPNQGNGAYIEDGGWCVVLTTWDWPVDNEQTNAYLFNVLHTPVDATTIRLQLRTQADQYVSGMAKFRLRLVDRNDYSKQIFLDCHGQTEEWFANNIDDNRALADKAEYAGESFDPTNGWIIIPGVPDYNIGEDYYFFTIPEEWRDKDVIMFIENDDLHFDDGYGHMVTGKCDKLLVCGICFVDGDNDPDKFRVQD